MNVAAPPPRAEIPDSDRWNLESIFPTEAAWEAEVATLPGALDALGAWSGRLGEGPEVLAAWLAESWALRMRVERAAVYGQMGHHVDSADPSWRQRNDRGAGLRARMLEAVAFAEPEVLALGRDTVLGWIAATPKLHFYEMWARRVFDRQPHIRSSDVEELLGAISDPFQSATRVHGTASDADLTFAPACTSAGKPVTIGQGSIGMLLSDADATLRRSAWENYADGYLGLRNTFADCFLTGARQNVFISRARRYESALEASLKPREVPVAVYHNLIAAYRKNLPTWHRYWAIKKRALKLDVFRPCDVAAPIGGDRPGIDWKKSVNWICDGMAPLGEEYVSTFRRGIFEERWVDWRPNQNKRGGAYSGGQPGTHPFIFMTYNNDVFGLSTLAHEIGHSMHSWMAWKTQPPAYCDYTEFVAEVASNFNQALVRKHLLDTQKDPAMRMAILEEAMANLHRYLFLMPALARFEFEVHSRLERGQGVGTDELIQLMSGYFGEAFGPDVEIDRDRVGITWAQFPIHMYLNFYVFTYATGIAAAQALATRVMAGETGARESYLEFLSAGGSLPPIEALKRAGVDMTQSEPVDRAFGVLAEYVDAFEELVGN
ncbi:MAG: oligoendopeptidase F [Candidatus Eisenbacteria bacterium]|nr:oligoendopeptidase F [Candidatus Eisenbacteria bacterium]